MILKRNSDSVFIRMFRVSDLTGHKLCYIEKIFIVLGFKPQICCISIKDTLPNFWAKCWSLKWTFLQILINLTTAILIQLKKKYMLANFDPLSCTTDILKVISLFIYTFVVYVEVIINYQNYFEIDKITLEIEALLVEVDVKIHPLKNKIKKRFLMLAITFFLFNIIVTTVMLIEKTNDPRVLLFLYLLLYPQLLKFLRPFQFLFYLTKLLIYLESVSIEINKGSLSVSHLLKMFKIKKCLDEFYNLYIRTIRYSLLAFIWQESFHFFTDFYWIILYLVLGKCSLYWMVSVLKALLFFQVFYNGQLYINLVSFYVFFLNFLIFVSLNFL